MNVNLDSRGIAVPAGLRRRLPRALAVRLGLLREARVRVAGRTLTFPGVRGFAVPHALCVEGVYEPELLRLVGDPGWQAASFVDGGANTGLFAAVAEAARGPGVRVVAIEPVPANVAYLRALATRNGLAFDVIEAALWRDASAAVALRVPTGRFGTDSIASLRDRFAGGDGTFADRAATIEVRAVTLDGVVSALPGPILVKLDCEGAELDILLAATATLARDDVEIVLEINIGAPDKHELFALMIAAGFRGYLMTTAGLAREDRPLALPTRERPDRTLWRNHLFTKRDPAWVDDASRRLYGAVI